MTFFFLCPRCHPAHSCPHDLMLPSVQSSLDDLQCDTFLFTLSFVFRAVPSLYCVRSWFCSRSWSCQMGRATNPDFWAPIWAIQHYSQRSASKPAIMHRALLVEEILARVVDESDIYANLVLARTCHSFTELALDAMWADRGTVELWGLAQYMSDELSVQESSATVDSWPTTVHVLVSRPLRLRCDRS
jgi:hypothetical protein